MSYFSLLMNSLREQGLYRSLRIVDSDQGSIVNVNGKQLINFSSNNYLGLANHPLLKEAAISAIKDYGVGSGASRLITGSMTLHDQLELAIARFKRTERALIFNSGYLANSGVIPALTDSNSLIFSDELNHASLIDGCRLSKAKTNVYRHNDMGHLESFLNASRTTLHASRLIVTDSVFSMDGDLCPLPEILKLAEKYDALVYVDEAHGTGVFGKTGRGVVEHFCIESTHPRLIQMGTLGKALGSFGAYICGSNDLIELLINRARSFIFSTSLPPAVLGASLAAVELIEKDLSYKEKLWENVEYFCARLVIPAKAGIQLDSCLRRDDKSPIIPIIIGDAQKTMEVSQKLFEKGIWVQGIRPPTVAEGTSRLRLTITASHTREQLDFCLNKLKQII